MLTTIETPPTGIEVTMQEVADVAEAAQLAGKADGYLFQSHTIKALYLFVPIVTAPAQPQGTGAQA